MKDLQVKLEEDEDREVFAEALQQKSTAEGGISTSPKKVHPLGPKSNSVNVKELSTGAEVSGTGQRRQTILLLGVLGLVVCTCLGWTGWLILLNVAPNDTVNRIMDTETFDYGSFWLMIDTSKMLVRFATFGLSAVAIAYLGVLFKMVLSQRCSKRSHTVRSSSRAASLIKKMEKAVDDATSERTMSSNAATLVASLVHKESSTRKNIKLLMKFGDLALETFLLHQTLQAGSPAVLIGIFTTVVASNALCCAAMMFVPYERAPLAEILVDILFDFLVAVGYPMLVLFYCFSTFTFDRAKLAINLQVFPMGWFEQNANVIADPVQTAVIYKILKSLRIMSALEGCSKMLVNFMLCYRLFDAVALIQPPRRKHHGSVYPKSSRLGASILVLFAVVLIIFTEESVRTSSQACQPHPECAVHARRWITLKSDLLTQCPCLILIDRDIAPKTFAEWEKPQNVMEKVAQLATTGDLQALQLANRFLPTLPDELRLCTNLKHLSLMYTHTQVFPPWVKELRNLEFLHVESKVTSPMVFLPDDMFDDMSSLTFIHLAFFLPMSSLPSFQGLVNLKSLTLALFISLKELPSFDTLHKLERLVLACLSEIDSLPDLTALQNLKSLVAADRGAWCCNGFLGDCNLDDERCKVQPIWGNPAATCLPSNRTEKVATPATIQLLQKFSKTICTPVLPPGAMEGPPTPDNTAPCDGKMYRQCKRIDNVEAMCYNARFMGIACTANPFPIQMRRRQIAQGVGDPCDPEIEAWLGCK
ncbi:hypothetical protein KRP22_006887 [Phytophthora ramorum]|nr:hypothetical protein KRP22_1981 [Phytophthora ramorum]